MIIATCPNDSEHTRFTTTAHVMQEWTVDKYSNFLDEGETLQTTHGPTIGNEWTCFECGADAKVEDVN